jgi:hypothetical protein
VVIVAVAFAALAGSGRAAEVDRYLPNETQAVSTVNVRQILDSGLVKKVGLDQAKGLWNLNPAHKLLEDIGFDPFKDLSTLTFASTGGSEPDKWFVIAHGKFDLEKCHAKAQQTAKSLGAGLKVQKVGASVLYEATPPDGTPAVFTALVDPSTAVFSSSKELVVEVLDKAAGKKQSAIKPEIRSLIEKSNDKQSFWLAILLNSELTKNPLIADEKVKEVLDKIKSLSGGFTVADDFKLELALGAQDATAAKDIADLIQQGVANGKELLGVLGDNKAGPPAAEMLNSVKVNQQGNGLTIKGQISKPTLDRALDKNS